MIFLCCILSWHGFIDYRFSQILRDGGYVDFSWIREVFFGIVDGFSRKSEGQSSDMGLRGDCSQMSLGYLDENSHSPHSWSTQQFFLLERYNPLFLSGALCLCLSFMDMDLELWYMSQFWRVHLRDGLALVISMCICCYAS